MSAPSHYERLGLPNSASAEDLRQAFRLLSKRYHPDTTSLPLGEAEAAFQALQHAYGVLSDPEQRQRYDALLLVDQGRLLSRPPQRVVLREPELRRPLSGGEWLALLLLALAAVFALVLGVGLAWMRGVDLIQWPSWWLETP
jgi:curved DNA-binding protein CbpA